MAGSDHGTKIRYGQSFRDQDKAAKADVSDVSLTLARCCNIRYCIKLATTGGARVFEQQRHCDMNAMVRERGLTQLMAEWYRRSDYDSFHHGKRRI